MRQGQPLGVQARRATRALNGSAVGAALLWCLIPRAAVAEQRCGTRSHAPVPALEFASGHRTNCSASFTNPDPSYAEGGLLEFKLVVHVLENEDGSLGQVDDAQILEQIRVLNEDFRGTGAALGGADAKMSFALATVDPDGNATTGITRHNDAHWFEDRRRYWEEIHWDPTRYVNVYTNAAQGLLGYTYLPADPASAPGAPDDRIVIEWQHIGRNQGAAGNRGRTLTHEMGHYFGLDHPFAPNVTAETLICAPAESPDCYGSGDLICDTASEDAPNDTCEPRATCGSPDPIENFMDYTPDACMDRFTSEQALRMRCSVLGYRADLPWPAGRILVSELAREDQVAPLGLELVNESAFAQTFALRVDSTDAVVEFRTATSERTAIALEPGATFRDELLVTLPEREDADLELVATSSENERIARLPVTVERDPDPRLGLLVDALVRPASPPSPALFTVTVENRGALSETVDIRASSDFAAELSEASPLSIPAFESRTFEVTVLVPSDAPAELVADVAIDVTSTRRPSIGMSERLQVRVARWVDALLLPTVPLVEVRPGQTGVLEFTLENLGNATESFGIDASVADFVRAWPHPSRVGPLAPGGQDDPLVIAVDYAVAEDAAIGAALDLRLVANAEGRTRPAASGKVEFLVVDTGRLELHPRLQTRSGLVNTPLSFELDLVNRSSEDDRVSVTVDSQSELLSEPVDSTSLRSGERRTLRFELGARASQQERTTITVQSLEHEERVQRAEVLVRWTADHATADAGQTASTRTPQGCSCRTARHRGPNPSWVLLGLAAALRRRKARRRS